jgi:hypothetical protein
MKLLDNIPKEKYSDTQWVLDFIQNNPQIGNEDTDPIQYFHCFWKGVITDLHLMALDSLFKTHPNAEVFLWVSDRFEVGGSYSWFEIKRKYKHRVKMVEITVDHFKDANADILYSRYVTLLLRERDLSKYNSNVAYASDIIRFVVLHLYGGVWFDLDILFLRSFDSIHLKRYVSQWGTDMCGNAAILKLEKGHDLINKIMKLYPQTPFYPFVPKHPELSTFTLENELDITILPSTFFDILWGSNLPEDLQFKTFDEFFKIKELNLPKEIYAYHWHNRWDKPTPPFFTK